MQLLQDFAALVPTLEGPAATFQYGSFLFNPADGVWQPLQGLDAEYPVVLADVVRVRLADDFRLQEVEVALLFAQPHAEDLHDVPSIQQDALFVLQQLLVRYLEQHDGTLLDAPEIDLIVNAGALRLAGANLQVRITLPNPVPFCLTTPSA